jgi:hypothetical protein
MRKVLRFALASAATILAASGLRAQAPTHEYRFNGNLNDENAGPSLVSDGGVILPHGYSFGQNQGLNLSNVFTGGASNVYTVALEAYFTDVGGWRKFIDTKDRAIDQGLYNDPSQHLAFFNYASAPTYTFVANQAAFVVLTRDGAGLLDGYVNGVLQFTAADAGNQFGVFSAGAGIARFFEDDFVTGQTESAPGFVDYIATWDQALNAAQVGALSPPTVSATPEPASVLLVSTGLLALGVIVRRRSKETR